MRPRAVDWSLAALVAVMAVTGFLTIYAGAPGDAWVFWVHDVAGFALAGVLVWKLRRVRTRLRRPSRGLIALAVVVAALGTGIVWSSGGNFVVLGYNALNWHWVAGGLLVVAVGMHAFVRAKPLRRADATGRRQFLAAGAVGVGALALWQAQKPAAGLVGLRGSKRRFTGSYEVASFEGNAFPSTSWVSDDPRRIDGPEYRLELGDLRLGAEELDAGDELVATLDCTGGFHSTQRWSGSSLGRLLDRVSDDGASHVRIVSHTGYRMSYPIGEARGMLLATRVGGEPISHGHGAPVRLVAPDRRGFEWVKWVVRVELHDGPDPGALASTLWSSFTPAGRGA